MKYACALLLMLVPAAWSVDLPFSVTGNYLEARSNHVFGCYCEWSSESQLAGREAILAWEITEGEVAGTTLKGVRMAAVVVADSTLSMGDPPRKSILFVDSTAPEPQQRAAEMLLRQGYPRLLGRVVGVYPASIHLEQAGDQAVLKVGDVVSLTMRKAQLPEDALQGAVLWFDPFIPLEDASLGTTLLYKYGGQDFDHRWEQRQPEVTGYFGKFTLVSR